MRNKQFGENNSFWTGITANDLILNQRSPKNIFYVAVWVYITCSTVQGYIFFWISMFKDIWQRLLLILPHISYRKINATHQNIWSHLSEAAMNCVPLINTIINASDQISIHPLFEIGLLILTWSSKFNICTH